MGKYSLVCKKCNGTGKYQYDDNHLTICDKCCKHDKGWWLLEEHYGNNNGKYACLNGCGTTVDIVKGYTIDE